MRWNRQLSQNGNPEQSRYRFNVTRDCGSATRAAGQPDFHDFKTPFMKPVLSGDYLHYPVLTPDKCEDVHCGRRFALVAQTNTFLAVFATISHGTQGHGQRSAACLSYE
jgi:hypothetical protein